jgi:hypothetical protein
MSIGTRESKMSITKKLRLNQSGNPEFKKLISIEMSNDIQELEDGEKVSPKQVTKLILEL